MEDMADVSGDFVKQLCVCLIQQLVEWWHLIAASYAAYWLGHPVYCF